MPASPLHQLVHSLPAHAEFQTNTGQRPAGRSEVKYPQPHLPGGKHPCPLIRGAVAAGASARHQRSPGSRARVMRRHSPRASRYASMNAAATAGTIALPAPLRRPTRPFMPCASGWPAIIGTASRHERHAGGSVCTASASFPAGDPSSRHCGDGRAGTGDSAASPRRTRSVAPWSVPRSGAAPSSSAPKRRACSHSAMSRTSSGRRLSDPPVRRCIACAATDSHTCRNASP